MVDSGSNQSYIKRSALGPEIKLKSLETPHKILIVDGTYESHETAELDFFGTKFTLYVMSDSFPISITGILGLDWEVTFKAKIDREQDIYQIVSNKKIYTLCPGKKPLVELRPMEFRNVKILAKQKPGYYFIDGQNIVPGIYNVPNAYVQINLFNDSLSHTFLYRENIIFKPRKEFVEATDEYTRVLLSQSPSNQLNIEPSQDNELSIILNNKISIKKRKAMLDKYYEKFNGSIHPNIRNKGCINMNNTEREYFKNIDTEKIFDISSSFHTRIHNRGYEILSRFEKQIDNIKKEIDSKTADEISEFIREYNDVFVLPSDPLPAVDDFEHKIKLNTDKIISTPLYKHPIFMQPLIDEQIDKFYKQGLIRDSHSPYQSNVWLVPRKLDQSGQKRWRLVMDFRKLNSHTTQDNYPLPSIEEILCLLGQAKYMSAFDMSNGFHAIKVAAEDIEKTAFSTHKGHWEWVRLPMGLINSPATYQRCVNFKLRGLIGKICFIYIDDLIVIGKTKEEHLKNLRIVFNRLRETKLMLNPDKCSFLQKELEYLGHKITPQGIKPLERNVEKIMNFPVPTNKKELERFIGLASYYRKFIQNFAKQTYNMNRLKSKNIDFNFDENCQKEFDFIKKTISSYPTIAHPDNSKPYILHTDASNQGLGGTLSQIGDDGLEHPIGFISRSLNPCEKNYSTTEKELLAAQWCMKKYKHLLFGQRFDLYTDHQALRGIFNNKSDDVSSRIVRLLSKTTDYHPNIIYKKGKDNVVADALSRTYFATEKILPELNEDDLLADLNPDELQILENLDTAEINPTDSSRNPVNKRRMSLNKSCYIWINEEKSTHILKDYLKSKSANKRILIHPKIKNAEKARIIELAQSEINFSSPTDYSLFNFEFPVEIIRIKKPVHIIEALRVQNINDIDHLIELARSWKNGDLVGIDAPNAEFYNKTKSILLPFITCARLNNSVREFLPKYIFNEQSRLTIIIQEHVKNHWAVQRTYDTLKNKYIWEGMKSQIEEYIKQCNTCAQHIRHYSPCVPGVVIDPPKEPFEILNMDTYVYDGNIHLIIIDELSRYVWIKPNVQMTRVYKQIEDFFLQFEAPKKLITDNGKELKNEKMTDICRKFNIQRIPIAAQHPESNGICERAIETIKMQLDKDIPMLNAAYNYNHATHNTTKRTPIGLLYGISDRNTITLAEPSREEILTRDREIAIENTLQSKKLAKLQLDKRLTTRNKQFKIGDLVRLLVMRTPKAKNRVWSQPTPIRNINYETNTAYFHHQGKETSRHFNEIELYTANTDVLN